MSALIIGDFRSTVLQQMQHRQPEDSCFDYAYLLNDVADYTWLSENLSTSLAALTVNGINVVIMLGFNDCAYSCVWNSFDIDKLAEDYCKVINELAEQFASVNFCVCSVGPVDDGYAFAEYGNLGEIPAVLLDSKIRRFNEKLESDCTATFIDCYKFLQEIGFNTRDGVRYDQDTCLSILSYIKTFLRVMGGTNFVPRLEAPVVDDTDLECDIYWLGTSYGGLNPFEGLGQSYAKCPGDTLPNCTAYAWGRFYEIMGEEPKVLRANAECWYGGSRTLVSDLEVMAQNGTAYDGYERGREPRLGAILCWEGVGGEAGHVAIVEQINDDGSIVTSESGYSTQLYWWTKTRTNTNGNWGASAIYKFQGFIYCPITATSAPLTAESKEGLCTKNSYGITEEEMQPNARYIWNYFGSRGWSLNAVAALLGNMEEESKLSPCVWEGVGKNHETINAATGVHTLTSSGRTFANGYGLTQWTPATKFFAWCNNGGTSGNANGTGRVLPYWDIDTQLMRIEAEAEVSGGSWIENLSQWIKKPAKGYDITFKEFITSNRDPYWLAGAFAFCYERPARSTGTAAQQAALKRDRGENANKWYTFLSGMTPIAVGSVGGFSTGLQVSDFKLSKCESTSAVFSLLIKNGATIEYTLKQDDLVVSEEQLEAGEEFMSFTVSDLTPNKKYTLELLVTGSSGETTTESIEFKTAQSYPTSINSALLIAQENALPKNKFKLVIDEAVDWGYWKSNRHGYIMQLIKNGTVQQEKIISGATNNIDITLDVDFPTVALQLGDTVQIGIRTYVTDDSGNKIFDGPFATASNSICFLEQSLVVFLKTE